MIKSKNYIFWKKKKYNNNKKYQSFSLWTQKDIFYLE